MENLHREFSHFISSPVIQFQLSASTNNFNTTSPKNNFVPINSLVRITNNENIVCPFWNNSSNQLKALSGYNLRLINYNTAIIAFCFAASQKQIQDLSPKQQHLQAGAPEPDLSLPVHREFSGNRSSHTACKTEVFTDKILFKPFITPGRTRFIYNFFKIFNQNTQSER